MCWIKLAKLAGCGCLYATVEKLSGCDGPLRSICEDDGCLKTGHPDFPDTLLTIDRVCEKCVSQGSPSGGFYIKAAHQSTGGANKGIPPPEEALNVEFIPYQAKSTSKKQGQPRKTATKRKCNDIDEATEEISSTKRRRTQAQPRYGSHLPPSSSTPTSLPHGSESYNPIASDPNRFFSLPKIPSYPSLSPDSPMLPYNSRDGDLNRIFCPGFATHHYGSQDQDYTQQGPNELGFQYVPYAQIPGYQPTRPCSSPVATSLTTSNLQTGWPEQLGLPYGSNEDVHARSIKAGFHPGWPEQYMSPYSSSPIPEPTFTPLGEFSLESTQHNEASPMTAYSSAEIEQPVPTHDLRHIIQHEETAVDNTKGQPEYHTTQLAPAALQRELPALRQELPALESNAPAKKPKVKVVWTTLDEADWALYCDLDKFLKDNRSESEEESSSEEEEEEEEDHPVRILSEQERRRDSGKW